MKMEILLIASIASISAVAIVAMMLISRNQTSLKEIEKKISSSKITIPLRLQAYERCLIFLERIAPDSLLVRVGQCQTANELQSKLLSSIRSEFEHNLSQQLYLSQDAWTHIVNAKNNTVGLINSCSLKVEPTDRAIQLSRIILEAYANLDTSPNQAAKQKIKQEVSQLY
jgi:hypothetical protein